jgi:23S rRNA (cytidine1920-2'-O)/16S rRNA (cytidine1409-2'-O)-methyltransferase
MSEPAARKYVSRAGEKLAAALSHFDVVVEGRVAADLGSHVGGFVDCLLQHGAARVHSVDTSYGTLAWKLRKDPRVVVCERTNALHVELPEPVDLVTVDVGWTPQRLVLAHVPSLTTGQADVISLIKPHYEAPRKWLEKGVLPAERHEEVLASVRKDIAATGWHIVAWMVSPIEGHGGNREYLAHLRRTVE